MNRGQPAGRGHRWGFWAAILALAAQLAFGARVPADPVGTTAHLLAGDVPICHAAPADNSGSPGKGERERPQDCALCPLCLTLAAPSAMLLPGATLPPALAALIGRPAPPPPARAPPFRAIAAAQPRGPPFPA